MSLWGKARIVLLILVCAGSVGVLGRTLVLRRPLDPSFPVFNFPQESPLADWRADENFPIAKTESEKADHAIQARYYHIHDSMEIELRFIAEPRLLHVADPTLLQRMPPSGYLPLDVGLRFLVDPLGRVKRNLKRDSTSNGVVEMRSSVDTGSYGIWQDGDHLHLTGIIMASGRSVVTPREFARSAYLEQMSGHRLRRWLMGEALLPDDRCVLADVSVTLAGGSREEAADNLRRTWLQWYGWCAPRFVEMCDSGEKMNLGNFAWLP